jgi:integrase
MGSIRVRRETEKLFVDFRYRGERCREHTALNDTPMNRRKLEKLLQRIEAEIAFGTFDYARYFPNSILLSRFTSKGQTMPAISRVRQSAASGAAVRPVESMPFKEFANEWYSQYEIEWKRSYRHTVHGTFDKHLIPRFGAMDIGRITKEEILNFRSDLGKLPGRKSKEHLSAQRINHVMGVLRRLLEDGADRFQFTSPYQRIKPLKLAKSDVQPFTLNEVQLILQTVRKDFANYLKVRFFTGMRTGEVDGLKWRYVDFERRLILIRETVVNGQEDTTKTYDSTRDIQMSQVVCDALKAQYQATGNASPYVFCNRDAKPVDHTNFANRVWYPLLRHLKLPARRPYQTRHTAATLWLAAGESPEWIARQLGHTTTEMLFRVYSRFVPNLTRKDGSAFERLLNSAFAPPESEGGQHA